MADIRKKVVFNRYRSDPSFYTLAFKKGHQVKAGEALAFKFRGHNWSFLEVPVVDQEVVFNVQGTTSDHQKVFVSGSVTFHVEDPNTLAKRVDFAVDPDSGDWNANPLTTLQDFVTSLVTQYVNDYVRSLSLQGVLANGPSALRDTVSPQLRDSEEVRALGISVYAVRVSDVVIRNPELEKALATPLIQEVSKEADRAVAERRAEAVEKDRAIAEAEANTKLELAKKEQSLIAQQGENNKNSTLNNVEVQKLNTEASAQATVSIAKAQAEAAEIKGKADAAAEEARIQVYVDHPEVVRELAFQELAKSLGSVENLTITPDLVSKVLAMVSEQQNDA